MAQLIQIVIGIFMSSNITHPIYALSPKIYESIQQDTMVPHKIVWILCLSVKSNKYMEKMLNVTNHKGNKNQNSDLQATVQNLKKKTSCNSGIYL